MEQEPAVDQATIEGTVKTVARTGGIILQEQPDVWYNPRPHVKQRALETKVGTHVMLVLSQEGSKDVVGIGYPDEEGPSREAPRVTAAPPSGTDKAIDRATELKRISDAAKARNYDLPEKAPVNQNIMNVALSKLNPAQKALRLEAEQGTSMELARKVPGGVVELSGNEYVTYRALLAIAHEKGLRGIDTEKVDVSWKDHCALIKATVTMQDGTTYAAMGDSTPENTKGMVSSAFIRMAETRAMCRALRQATNIGMTSIEELEPELKDKAKPAAGSEPPAQQ